ncbi:unnamed protein product [Cunninghamella echinulata]
MSKTVLVLGATDDVGIALLKNLLKYSKYTAVFIMGQRAVELDNPIPKENDVYCCLDTTKAGAEFAEKIIKTNQEYVNSAGIIVEENPSKNNENTFKSSYANINSGLLFPQSKAWIFRSTKSQERYLETLTGVFIPKVNSLFNLRISIPVVNVGQAMKLTAQQSNSIPKDIQIHTSKIGLRVFIFSKKSIDEMTK